MLLSTLVNPFHEDSLDQDAEAIARALSSGGEIRSFLIAQVRQFDQLFGERVYPPFSDLASASEAVRAKSIDTQLTEAAADPDLDLGSVADNAHAQSLAFYLEHLPLQQILLNLFTAGLFHLFEQQMGALYRSWTCGTVVNNLGQAQGERFDLAVIEKWSKTNLKVDFKTSPNWPRIEELKDVANVVKHAEGPSAKQLRLRNPKLFRFLDFCDSDDDASSNYRPVVRTPLTGDDLFVSKADYDSYVADVLNFWEWLATAVDPSMAGPSLPCDEQSTTSAQ